MEMYHIYFLHKSKDISKFRYCHKTLLLVKYKQKQK